KMGGFVGGVNIENEDWLITPALNLSASTAPYLEFLHAAKFGLPSTELSVWASTNYDGSNLATANWVQLSVPNYPSGTDWTFIESGAVNLTQFAGQNNVRIGFKYTSTNTSATTWEIKEVKVY
ncbi:MAG: choice-of-anchor J domain-containing protein, partial [Bacteroidales bacterium]|nr:choice-of-anchor J domain-containing protein [Bacteroidales bacterium]